MRTRRVVAIEAFDEAAESTEFRDLESNMGGGVQLCQQQKPDDLIVGAWRDGHGPLRDQRTAAPGRAVDEEDVRGL